MYAILLPLSQTESPGWHTVRKKHIMSGDAKSISDSFLTMHCVTRKHPKTETDA